MVKLETKWTVNTQLHIGQSHHLVQGLGAQGKIKQNVAGRGWEGETVEKHCLLGVAGCCTPELCIGGCLHKVRTGWGLSTSSEAVGRHLPSLRTSM